MAASLVRGRWKGCPRSDLRRLGSAPPLEYRRAAAHLAIDTDHTITAVAAETNLGVQLLGRRVQPEWALIGVPPDAPLDDSATSHHRNKQPKHSAGQQSNLVELFNVSPATVHRILKRHRTTV